MIHLKAKITRVGSVYGEDVPFLEGWVFEYPQWKSRLAWRFPRWFSACAVLHEITTGKEWYGGYTADELRRKATR